jgi:histone-arginine methyltransferase CARM1
MLLHTENMLQDSVRTGTYHAAVHQNAAADFVGKTVMDVGAGSGILSYFSAQAGAARVYAVEASDMAENARMLIKANKFENVITIVKGKVEEISLPEKVSSGGVLVVQPKLCEAG